MRCAHMRRCPELVSQVKNDHIKLKATPAERMSKGVWVVVFSFKLCVNARSWLDVASGLTRRDAPALPISAT